MKDLLKQNILQNMSNILNFQQLQLLEKVIHQNLQNVHIEKDNSDKTNAKDNNEQLLHFFISSKKVEGCSEKSLKYYLSTIEALLKKLDKKIVEISTNDLRFYLSEYQEKKEFKPGYNRQYPKNFFKLFFVVRRRRLHPQITGKKNQ